MARQRDPFLGFHFPRVYTLGMVLPGAALNDRHLLYLWPCRDQPCSFRSARGRIRTRCRLPHRVQWVPLGGILSRGIWQYDHRLGNCYHPLPGWVGWSWCRVFNRSWHGFWLATPWQSTGHWLLRYQSLPALFRLYLGPQHLTAPASRPAHAVCLVNTYSSHPGKYPAYSPGLSHPQQLWTAQPGLPDHPGCGKLHHVWWFHLGDQSCHPCYKQPCSGAGHSCPTSCSRCSTTTSACRRCQQFKEVITRERYLAQLQECQKPDQICFSETILGSRQFFPAKSPLRR